jgi:hypothetical protein
MDINAVLIAVAKQGLLASSTDEIVKLACAYWHEGFIPNIDSAKLLPAEQQKIIGYLTEFFSTFNVVEKERAIKLVGLAHELKKQIAPVGNDSNSDEIAGEWGLAENLNEFHKDLLFYQTRHYVYESESG